MTRRKILYAILVLTALCLIVSTYMNITLCIEYSNSFRTSRSFLELREAHTHSFIKYFTISTVLAAVVALY